MKIHYIAVYEVGCRPNSHWEEKEFSTYGDAQKFADDWRRKDICNGAYATTRRDEPTPAAAEVHASATIRRYADKAFSGSKIF